MQMAVMVHLPLYSQGVDLQLMSLLFAGLLFLASAMFFWFKKKHGYCCKSSCNMNLSGLSAV